MANKHSGFKLISNIDADSKKIENLPDPTADQEPATKAYVDARGITQSETGVTDFDIVIVNGCITSFTKN